MSISTEIARLQTARNKIRAKLVALGLAGNTDNLDVLATAVEGIKDNGAVSASVAEGATYTIPKGYHNGSGTVSGVSGGGNYGLQSKTVTPTKAQQNVTPDSGYYGMSDVTVGAIPDNYQDVSATTATAAHVLANDIFVDKTGKNVAGTMKNNGAVTKTLDTSVTSYIIPGGYHSGSGKVSIAVETKAVTPNKTAQTVSPSSGKVLSKVTVNAIPSNYLDVSDGGNGDVSATMDGITTTSVTIPSGYTSGGTVSLTDDIENALAAI